MQDKVTVTLADVSTDYFPQSYTDAAVAAAVAAVVPPTTQPVVTTETVEVDLVLSDGSTQKFVKAA